MTLPCAETWGITRWVGVFLLVYRVNRDRSPDALVELLDRTQGTGADRELALGRLLALVTKLPELRRDTHPDYLDALNRTLVFVEQNLATFRYDRGAPPGITYQQFVRWVNGHLRFRILDLYRQGEMPLSLDQAPRQFAGDERMSDRAQTPWLDRLPTGSGALDGLEAWLEQQQRDRLQRRALLLELYIERDPEGRLGDCYAAQEPAHNCRAIAQALFLRSRGAAIQRRRQTLPAEPKITWRSLARQWQLNEQTLHSHWKRRCRPLLQEIAQNIDQNPDAYAHQLHSPAP